MNQNPEQAYLESRVYTANPGELVQILYEATLEAIHQALDALDRGDIAARARAITRASSCVMELAGSLNVGAGGELGVRLAVLYEYLLHELLEANVQQNRTPLRDCERVVNSLLEGWNAAMAQLEASATPPPDAIAKPLPPLPTASLLVFPGGTEDIDALDIEETDYPQLQTAVNSWCG